jgi:hypothetical protein
MRRYDVQAKWSVILSFAAVFPLMAVVTVLILRYRPDMKAIVFGNPLYQPGVMVSTAAAIGLACLGIILGINSAGQRRNEHQRRSWTGFFIGVLVLSLAIIAFAGFWMLRLKLEM